MMEPRDRGSAREITRLSETVYARRTLPFVPSTRRMLVPGTNGTQIDTTKKGVKIRISGGNLRILNNVRPET